jgi:hypothetical protein
MGSGQTSRLANDMMLEVRAYLNEGGRLLHTGKYAGFQYHPGSIYNPVGNEPCDAGCARLSRDFFTFYLSAYSFQRAHSAAVDISNDAGDGRGWWSGRNSNSTVSVEIPLDLTRASGPLTFAFDAHWTIEDGYDYGYVEVFDSDEWTTLPDAGGAFTEDDPHGQNQGWGLTGTGTGVLEFDVSAYAGEPVVLRLRYRTDRGIERAGWFVDNLRLADSSGVLFEDSLDAGFDGYTSNGWHVVPVDPPAGFQPAPVAGVSEPFEGLTWELAGPGRGNQDHTLSTMVTSRFMPTDTYPQFASRSGARYDTPGSGPRTGRRFVYSDLSVYTYQRLTRTIDVPAEGESHFSFWTAYDIWPDFDALFVEVRPVNTDEWTTLPELTGRTDPQTSLACTSASWFTRHPRLAHYMTPEGVGDSASCSPTGSTGQWHAASGKSQGWEEWTIDLAAYAGQELDLAISYISSREAFPGVLIDDVTLWGEESTSFEEELDGWTIMDAPEGSPRNTVNFYHAVPSDYPYAAITVTEDTIYFGFGFEGIVGAESRAAVMRRTLDYLLRDVDRLSNLYLPALRTP